jgi:glycosyltransferase involved in cell wall biosynthesis
MTTVLHVLEALEGGTRRHVRDLISALDPAAFRCELAVSRLRDPLDGEEELAGYAARGVPVHEIPMRRGIAPLSDLANLARLVRLVRRVRPGLIHAHSAKAGFLARLAGAWCRVPVVYTPHAFAFLMTCGERRRRLYRRLETSMRGRTAALIVVSEEEAREAARLGYAPERVALIRNGVRPADAGPVRVRESGELTVGFFGRLAPQKGPDLLLEAAAGVVAHLPQVRFRLFGGGAMEAALRERAEGLQVGAHVRFEGECRQEEVVARMREVDVVAVPSRWEGCPYAVLEAQQAGVPVAAAAVGGVPELIRDGVDGLVFEPESPEALCDALLSLLRDPQKRLRLAEQGRAAVAERGLVAMASAVSAVYRGAVLARR